MSIILYLWWTSVALTFRRAHLRLSSSPNSPALILLPSLIFRITLLTLSKWVLLLKRDHLTCISIEVTNNPFVPLAFFCSSHCADTAVFEDLGNPKPHGRSTVSSLIFFLLVFSVWHHWPSLLDTVLTYYAASSPNFVVLFLYKTLH